MQDSRQSDVHLLYDASRHTLPELTMEALINYGAAVVIIINAPREVLLHLGPVEGKHALERCVSRLIRVTESFHGQVLDTAGWVVTALFQNMKNATDAAYTMRRRIAQLPAVSQRQITVSIGAAQTPIKAQQVAEAALPNSVKICDGESHRRAEVRAIQNEDASKVIDLGGDSRPSSLLLRHGAKSVVLNQEIAEVTLGRGIECSLRVNDEMASRLHATIRRDGERFTVRDHSTNGTFIQQADGQIVLIHRRVYVLRGGGKISLGAGPESTGGAGVAFQVA